MGGACGTNGRGEYRGLVCKSEGKNSLRRPRPSWEGNITMNLQEVEWDMDWVDLAQERDR
jgi:hypothetical protein